MLPIFEIVMLLLIVGVAFVGWRYRLQRIEEKLRDNPPERRIVEVSLPVGIKNSPAEMARFYRKVSSSALGDKKARAMGVRQIDFVYIVDVPSEGASPRLRCRIYADPDQMDAVKKALKASFRESLDLVEMKEDDLREIAMQLRPPENKEDPAEMDMQEMLPGGTPPEGLPAAIDEAPEFDILNSSITGGEDDEEEAEK